MESYTIKDAAELLGMTKPGIRYRLKKLGESLPRDEAGQIIITPEVLEKIRDTEKPESEVERRPERTVESEKELSGKNVERSGKISGKSEDLPEKEAESFRKAESDASPVTLALVEMLRRDLDKKDAQIASLSAQLSDTTEALKSAQTALTAAQALHAATEKRLQELEAKQNPVETIIQNAAEPVSEQKKEDPENKPEEEALKKEEQDDEKPRFIPDDEDEDEEEEPPTRGKLQSFFAWLFGRV